ncbi:PE-PPE domain-containing protein [Mycolicibacterium pyrenivorans]|uniref:PE-PPE domain-containing protein n=1 Tax=Mycolicibacterium pyrenivorans TaxID=187102 RepID=UPI0021F28E7F|nr:PE-PPE domain-containing protein [Mycolicibacterium pyrenivorans]MCV7152041.1 PE-PPE domain-containing protein [Mycolicibacterium pyrenivorans]
MTTSNKGTAHKKCRGALMVAAVTTLPFIAALSAGGSAPTAAAAEIDYFGPEPATVLTMALFRNGGDQDELQGLLCESPRTCVSVPFPYLQRSIGVDDLDEAIHGDTFGQRQIVFGYSQGARVATDWLEEFAAAEDAPSADDLSFVLIGNPGRKYGGAHVIWHHVTPDTQYQVLDVARQYDLTADRPDRFSLLAMANAYAGLVQLHGHYEDVDIYDPANYVWKEGNTTYVFVPTEDLPILNGLRRLGLDELADQLQGPLKEKIEKAYDRSYLPAESGWPAEVEPEPEEPPVDPPAESKQTFLTSARSVQTISAEEPTARQESDPDLDVGSLSSDDELGARIDEVDGQPADDADEDTGDADVDGEDVDGEDVDGEDTDVDAEDVDAEAEDPADDEATDQQESAGVDSPSSASSSEVGDSSDSDE